MMVDDVLTVLRSSGLKRASAGEPMARHTSWRIGGPADFFCVAEDEAQLLAAVRAAADFALPWLVLGGGNNILVSDRGVEGLVILNRVRHMAVEDQDDRVSLACGAGVFFAKAAQFTARRGLTGMEWGIAIPGTVGGGVVNNAGAHWSDVSQALISAEAIDAQGRIERLEPADLAYRYRQSSLKSPHSAQSRLVVTGCRFRLERDTAAHTTARLEELRQHRLRTQPVKEASAGSTFKNPPNGHAGALIDQCGLKGHRIGGAQIAPLHANFILNGGQATANDVIELIQRAQSCVWDRFGVRLEPEIQFVGRWPDDVLHTVLGEAA
jgi:UDP-N-acetylmuramate dehydrogenase